MMNWDRTEGWQGHESLVNWIKVNYASYFLGTGYIGDTGMSRGKYYTVNVPLKDGIQDEQFVDIFTR